MTKKKDPPPKNIKKMTDTEVNDENAWLIGRVILKKLRDAYENDTNINAQELRMMSQWIKEAWLKRDNSGDSVISDFIKGRSASDNGPPPELDTPPDYDPNENDNQ